ncbi:hypothetical protein ACQPXS_02255 [Streptomyces sp. CA-142005]|uniref:hypothetical protein n=1 Tax=Streptomyces sp. CA-142005 TaxID=3240052 RepID=UPI003D8A5179
MSEPLDRDQRGEAVLGDEADEGLALLEVRRRLDTGAEGSTARALIAAQQSVVEVVDENRDLDLVDRLKTNGVHRGPEGGTRRSTRRFGGDTCSKTHGIGFCRLFGLFVADAPPTTIDADLLVGPISRVCRDGREGAIDIATTTTVA